ncbi:MAG: DNA internalization-related competence protein ComEC/Rec2 [Comamonadaceae bacterium]|nr:MAG: DNA internalization-related competence protein ComEC/Rec2 [Comamonadaceae bacterium]
MSASLAGFVGGVALQLQQAALSTFLAYALIAAAALAGWLVAGRLRGRRDARRRPFLPLALLTLLTLSSLAGGFALTGLRAANFQQTVLDPALEGRDLRVSGEVLAMPQVSEDGVRFRIAGESAFLDGVPVSLPAKIDLGWYAGFGGRDADASSDVDLSALELQRKPQTLRAGDRWDMTVRLKAPHGSSNPFGFDYELWMWEQGVQAGGYVRAGPRDVPPRKLSDSWRHPVERARHSVRDAVFETVHDRPQAGVLAALVTGDQNAIERAGWDVFRATGVAHLISISGVHITMFYWLALRLIASLWRRSTRLTPRLCLALPAPMAGAWGGLLLATLYALFSGWGVPAQRTIWMLATMLLLRSGGRQWPWHATWLLAMAVVVALDPWALMQAGFWLSFVAVGVLFAVGGESHPDVRDTGAARPGPDSNRVFAVLKHAFPARLARLLPALGAAGREQWIVTLALTPLSLLLFNQVSVVGFPANAVAIPVITLVVTPLAMIGVAWHPAWNLAAMVIGWLVAFLQWLASWPWAAVNVAAAPLVCAVAGVAGGILLVLRLPWHWRALGVPLMLPVLFWQAPRPPPGQFELLGADIGQGNAVIVRTATHALLYDAGPRFSSDSDAGHRVLVPLLRALDERLDLVVISHRDNDHIGGAATVLAMQPQASLLSSIEAGNGLQAVRPARRCEAGQRWQWDGVDFEILHPQAADYHAPSRPNAMSCVLRIASHAVAHSSAGAVALLAGDIELPQEQRLLGDPRLKADFLLMPHHGSKTSSSASFLDAVMPRFALAQAGYRNRFGHPVNSVVQRYLDRGALVVQSPFCGAAGWRSDRPGEVTCQRRQGLRYWHHRVPGDPGTP